MREIESIRSLLPLLNPYRWAIPVVVALGILSSGLEGFGISLLIPFLQSFDPGAVDAAQSNVLIGFLYRLFKDLPSPQRFFIIPFCIFVCIALKNGLTYGNALLLSWLNARIGHHLRSQVFRQLLSLSDRYLESEEYSKLSNLLATETWNTTRALGFLFGLISNFCTLLVFVVILQLLSWQLTLSVSLMICGISLCIQRITRSAKRVGRQAVEANQELAGRMWESLTGMRVIRAFGREGYEQARFDRASHRVQRTFLSLDVISASIGPLYEVLSALVLLTLMAIALSQNKISMPSLLTFLFILYRLQPQVQQMDSARIGLLSWSGSVQEVTEFLRQDNKPYVISGPLPFQGWQRSLSFREVSFEYDSRDKRALDRVSFEIPRGKTIAIVGPSGAGKSTLVNLICRFYEPTEGALLVDDCPLLDFDLIDWRDQIAIVSQEVYIFNATVRENIAYGRLGASDVEIAEAVKLANADQFIRDLPQGLETKVGDRGFRLSGGQRQRLALARAIVRDPQILILDEATNALDSISEHLIQDALNTLSQNRTVILIAHRLSTIEHADKILVLKDGRLVEQGNLEQLLNQRQLFAQLYHLQNRNLQT